ncbi:MAG: aminoglycoside phosphotransferase family protein [Cohnella sp.]|nr:aminoglycoside phosphotransferase family protein [Cohnella sp.]
MTAYERPKLDPNDIEGILREHFSSEVTAIAELKGGNIGGVYRFVHDGGKYVIKFTDLPEGFETERFVSGLLTSNGIPFPKCIAVGKLGPRFSYVIFDWIEGSVLADYPDDRKALQIPELVRLLTRMNHIDVSETKGYGRILPNGDGAHASWRECLDTTFAEDQTGTFWENWTELFRTSRLEKDVFDECHARMMAYARYNEPHRHFVHGDMHPWNILSDGERIAGLIDGNFAYGDFLIDLATLEGILGRVGIIEAYERYQEQSGIVIPQFKERLIGAHYYKGLDGLRFYAKMGMDDGYDYIRSFMLNLV